MGLPLLQYNTPDQEKPSTDFDSLESDLTDKTVLVEIDLRRVKRIEKVLKTRKLDCYPVFWSFQDQ